MHTCLFLGRDNWIVFGHVGSPEQEKGSGSRWSSDTWRISNQEGIWKKKVVAPTFLVCNQLLGRH